MAKTSDSMLKAISKYQKEKTDEIKLRVPKGKKSVIEDIAKSTGESVNGYVKKSLKTQIKTDTGQDVEL